MKRFVTIVNFLILTFFLIACSAPPKQSDVSKENSQTQTSASALVSSKESSVTEAAKKNMQIRIQVNGNTTVYELNESPAAKALYAQLPLSMDVEDYSSNEKIFYPSEKLDTTDTPLADGKLGTLAYYAPWGDVVMFYDSFGSASGLYELGNAISGSEYIKEMTGTIQIEKVDPK